MNTQASRFFAARRLGPRWLAALLLLLFFGLLQPGKAWSQAAVRLDDSTSPRASVQAPQVLDENGRPLIDNIQAEWAVIPFGWVSYRLSTASYIGRQVRIYYEVPVSIARLRSPKGLVVEWRSRGRFQGGRAHAGERVLVWSGMVQEAWMQESLDLTARLRLQDADLRSNEQFGFESFFMIEVVR